MASPVRLIAKALPVLLALGAMPWAHGAVETWIGSGISNWSIDANWLDGTAPAPGGDPALTVQFQQMGGTSASLNPGNFSLAQLDFARAGAVSIGLTGTGTSLRFTGPAPQLSASAPGPVFFVPFVLAGTTPELRITGSGEEYFQLSSPIGEEGASQKLVIETVRPRAGIAPVELAAANSFTGGVDLRSGNLRISHKDALGAGPLRVYGGAFTPAVSTLANGAILYSDLLLADANPLTWSGVVSSAVPHTGLTIRGINAVTMTAASTYTGATTVDFSLLPSLATYAPGTLSLTGAGSIRQSSALNLYAGATLSLEADAAATDRLGDSAALNLRSGTLRLDVLASGAGTRAETAGQVTLTGASTIALAPLGGSTVRLNVAGFERPERGTLVVTGLGASGAGTGQLFSSAQPALVGGGGAAGATNISIVPYAVSGTTSFVTYTAAGDVRALDISTEYATTLTAGADRNVRLSSGMLASAATVNSLWLESNTDLGGGGTLSIASGAVTAEYRTSLHPNLAFGAVEGVITVASSLPAAEGLTIHGNISGSNGVTKAGAGTLVLEYANTFTGPLTINSGLVQFTAENQLGAGTDAIVLNDRSAGLEYHGAGAGTLSRSLALNNGIGILRLANNYDVTGDLTFTGNTSGPGGLRVLATPTEKITLAGNATHTGPTILGGRIGFASDSALGAGDLAFESSGSPQLELAGDWITARRIDFSGYLPLQTNGFNVLLSGPLTGSGTLFKTSPGNLRITSASAYSPTILMDSGRLEIAGTGIFGGSLTLTGGAALVLDNGAAAQNNRISTALLSAATLTVVDGEVRLEGNAATPVHSRLNALRLSNQDAAGHFVVSVTSPGTAGNTLQIASFTPVPVTHSFPAALPPVQLRAASLGGAAGAPYTRIVLTAAAAGFATNAIVDDPAGATSFAINDLATDAAGAIGLRPLQAAEYSSASDIRNPLNGGATPVDAHLLLAGPGAATGAQNVAKTLTANAGGSLSLAPGQQLLLTAGGIIARPGATPARISGGTLDLGAQPFGFYTAGDLELASSIVAGAGAVSKFGPGALVLQSGAHLPATVIVGAGKVTAAAAAPLRDSLVSIGPLGTLDFTTAAEVGGLAGTGQVQTNGQIVTLGTLPADFTFGGTISGSGGLRITGGGTLSGDSSFTGALAVDGGKITLTGTALQAGAISIKSGTLTVDQRLQPATRLRAAPIAMNGGTLAYYPFGGGNSDVTLGPLTGAGLNTVHFNNEDSFVTPGPQDWVAFADLARQERGAFHFEFQTPFQPTGRFDFTSDLSGQLIGNPAVPTARPVLPYAVMNYRPVTFEPGAGLRPLDATEQTSSFTAGQNLLVTSTTGQLNTDLTVNSLETASNGDLRGSGTLRVTSGLVTGTGDVSVKLDFGAVEGILFNLNSGRAEFSGQISGTNGLTVNARNFYGISLSGGNTFTGPLTINSGEVYFNSPASFGPVTSPIVLRGATLIYEGSAGVALSRGLDLREGSNKLTNDTFSAAPLTLTGPITGAGRLILGGDVTLTNTNSSYTGTTTLTGTLRLPDDRVFGQSPAIALEMSTSQAPLLTLTGDWVSSRAFAVNGAGTLDTGSFNAKLDGPVTGSAQLTKGGPGVLTIHDGLGFTGALAITAGTVRLGGNLGGTQAITVSAAGRLEGNATLSRPVTLSGALAPGLGIGAFETGSVTFNAGSRLELQLMSPSSFDQLRVKGTVAFSGAAQLTLDLAGANFGNIFQLPILLNDGTDAIALTGATGFALGANILGEGESFYVGEQPFQITYAGGDGNDVYLSVPEPGTAALLVLGALPLLRRRRRQRRCGRYTKMLANRMSTSEVTAIPVSTTVQVRRVCATVMPRYSFTNQKPESLTCERMREPEPMARTSSSRFTWMAGFSTIGSMRPAAMVTATVAEPTAMRSMPAISQPRMSGETGAWAAKPAMALPTPEASRIFEKPPPAPTTRKMAAAGATHSSLNFKSWEPVRPQPRPKV